LLVDGVVARVGAPFSEASGLDRYARQMNRTWAYLDPGSAGVVLQMIGGGAAAVAVTLKLYGRRIMRRLHIGASDPETVTERDAP
jgi:hypothetical protein